MQTSFDGLEWETIDNNHQRAKVIGGWIVKSIVDVIHNVPDRGMIDGRDWREAMCFVPDQMHYWKVKK